METNGGTESVSDTCYKQFLSPGNEKLQGDDLLNAPTHAIAGVCEEGAAALEKCLKVKTIAQLADSAIVGKAKALAQAAREQRDCEDIDHSWLFDESVPMASADGESSEDNVKPGKVVIGYDERVVVDPLEPPYFSAICYLGCTAPNGKRYRGTGFYINFGGRAALLTAAHVLHSRADGGMMRSVEVIRARSGRRFPFGRFTVRSSALRVPAQWSASSDPNFDWGIILVDGESFGFGVAALDNRHISNMTMRTAGYPGDKPGYKMWFETGPVTRVLPGKIFYKEDTAGGQSGSPVWVRAPAQDYWLAVGVHVHGRQSGNSATRITPDILAQITAWTN